MPPSERAKQFATFAALRGLDEALEQKRVSLSHTERPVLPEERCSDLNDALCALQPGDSAEITYYRNGACRSICGAVAGIDPIHRFLRVEEAKIAFSDLLDIKRI